MLTRFTVGNFLSFNKPQTFSMIAGSVQKHKSRLYQAKDMKLLKFSAIYGANAAGKSNLVKAIEYARDIIIRGITACPEASPFKLDPSCQESPSYFEFELCISGRVYSYGFEVVLAERQILEEWLILLSANKEQQLFYRNTKTGLYDFDRSLFSDQQSISRFTIYLDDLKHVQDTFFLQGIVTNKAPLYQKNDELKILKDVFGWILALDISFPSTPVSGYSCFTSTSTEQILDAIRTFSTGISQVKPRTVTRDSALEDTPEGFRKTVDRMVSDLQADQHTPGMKGLRVNCNGKLFLVHIEHQEPVFNEITFIHEEQEYAPFSLSEESDGTRRLLDMLTVLICTKEHTVFIIDEIDRSLHPQLTVHFIKNFLSLAAARDIQLIITTHESHLLDLSLLRQDEIWFAEKNRSGATNLTPFDRFKERFDKRIERAYLDGRYGGVPLFDTFFFPDGYEQEPLSNEPAEDD